MSRWTAGLFLVLKCQPWDKEEESATIITFENKETSTQSMVIIKESRNIWKIEKVANFAEELFLNYSQNVNLTYLFIIASEDAIYIEYWSLTLFAFDKNSQQ